MNTKLEDPGTLGNGDSIKRRWVVLLGYVVLSEVLDEAIGEGDHSSVTCYLVEADLPDRGYVKAWVSKDACFCRKSSAKAYLVRQFGGGHML